MVNNILKVFILCMLAAISINLHAEKVIGVSAEWPPFTDSKHKRKGIVVELLKEAFASQGMTYEHKTLPWKRAVETVKRGDYGIVSSFWFNEERTKSFKYSNAYLQNDIVFIKRKGDNFEYDGLSSLAGKSIGTMRGYAYPEDFMKAAIFERQDSGDLLANIKKLIAGRVDLALDDEIVVRTLLSSQAPELLEKIEFVGKPLTSEKLYIGSGLQNEKHHDIIEAFNQGLFEIKQNGKYDAILKSYGVVLN